MQTAIALTERWHTDRKAVSKHVQFQKYSCFFIFFICLFFHQISPLLFLWLESICYCDKWQYGIRLMMLMIRLTLVLFLVMSAPWCLSSVFLFIRIYCSAGTSLNINSRNTSFSFWVCCLHHCLFPDCCLCLMSDGKAVLLNSKFKILQKIYKTKRQICCTNNAGGALLLLPSS